MNLIAIGDVVLNLDRITALDVDREAGLTLKIYTDSKDPVITFDIPLNSHTALMNLVPAHLRLSGRDKP